MEISWNWAAKNFFGPPPNSAPGLRPCLRLCLSLSCFSRSVFSSFFLSTYLRHSVKCTTAMVLKKSKKKDEKPRLCASTQIWDDLLRVRSEAHRPYTSKQFIALDDKVTILLIEPHKNRFKPKLSVSKKRSFENWRIMYICVKLVFVLPCLTVCFCLSVSVSPNIFPCRSPCHFIFLHLLSFLFFFQPV